LTVSEQLDEQTSGETAFVGCGSTVSIAADPLIDSVMASVLAASTAQPPLIAPNHEAPPKADPPELSKAAEPRMEPPKVEATLEAVKVEPFGEKTGKVRTASTAQAQTIEAAPRKRRFAAMAGVVALATIAGAVGGALTTAGFTHVADAAATTSGNNALESAIARIDADIVALKAGLEQTAKIGVSQFNKTSDRLDKVEKTQAEPATKLAKLSEAVDKLRAAQAAVPAAPVVVAAASPAPAAATSVAPKDVTGTVTTPAGTAALPAPAASPAAPPKTEAARLPTVEGWVLRDVGHGGALIQGRNGLYEVYAGDPVPGLGRVDAIRKQDGRWVVVTTRGLVVSR
jgi:hypothetical protein